MQVVVLGGSIAGLAAALAFARDGHDVTVLERDPSPPGECEEAFVHWQHRGVGQLRQAHAFLACARNTLRDRAPDVLGALQADGITELPMAQHMPPDIEDRRPALGDDELVILLARRTTFEWSLRRHVAREGRVTLRGGVTIAGLDVVPGDPPRVRGAVTDGGERVGADLVIDAMGRRSRLTEWLTEAGCAPPREEREDCGLTYYTRFYRTHPGAKLPRLNRGFAAGGLLSSFSLLQFLGDHGVNMIALSTIRDDAPLKAVRQGPVFDAVVRAVPSVAAFLDISEPITDVQPMGSLHNTLTRHVVDGAPVALGVHAIGDATSTTDPSFGRGVSLAVKHAFALAGVVREHADPHARALAAEALLGREVEPWFRDAVAQVRARNAAWRHVALGEPAPPAPAVGGFPWIAEAARYDPIVWRKFARRMNLLDLPTLLASDVEVRARVEQAIAAGLTPTPLAGPTRAELLRIVGAG
ncbi:MAG: FAD-dependent oxidoreductase [Polyangiales bacterium]